MCSEEFSVSEPSNPAVTLLLIQVIRHLGHAAVYRLSGFSWTALRVSAHFSSLCLLVCVSLVVCLSVRDSYFCQSVFV